MAIVTTSRNLTSVSYATGEIIEIRNGAVLTIDSTPTTRPGTIQCITSGKLRIENANTSTPIVLTINDMDNDLRFEAGGVLEIRGAPMALSSGTGAAQTWDFTSLFGGVIPQVNYVEVEEVAGSGVFMPWPVIQEDPKFNLNVATPTTIGGADPTAFTAGNTDAGQVLFWHETNKTLRCGNNTQGRAVPNGCAVRIPNIYITNRLLTNHTRAVSVITHGAPTGGNFTIQITLENGTVLGTTGVIASNATAATVDAAIEAITGAGTATTTGGPLPTAVNIVWAGAYATQRLGTRIAANNLTGGTNPTVHTYETTAGNLSLIDLSPLGTMDVEWCSFSDKFRFVTDIFKSVRLISVAVGADGFQLNNSNGSVEIDGLAITRSPFVVSVVSQLSSVLGTTSIRRVVNAAKNLATGALFLNNLPGLTSVDRNTSILFGARTATSNRSIIFQTLPAGLIATNIVAVGSAMAFTNLTNATIANWKYADGIQDTNITTNAMTPIFTSNCVNCTWANYADAGPMSPRTYGLMSTDAVSSGLKILGAVSNVSNNPIGPALMQCSGLEMSNVQLSNVRTGPLVDLPTNFLGNRLIIRKLLATFQTAASAASIDACQDGIYDLVSSTIVSINENFAGVNNFVGGNYADPSLTPTTGHVTFGPFGEGTGLVTTGATFTDGLGGLLLPEAGDTAVITMPFAMHAITGFQNVNPFLFIDSPGAIANLAVVGNPGGATGGTFTITVANSSGTVLGTTSAIAFNASTTTVSAAINAIPGAGTASTAGTLAGGYIITFPGLRIVTCDGTNLTGGEFPGVAFAVGRARLQNGTEDIGTTTPIDFAMRVPGTDWPAYQTLSGANLQSAFSSLVGYQAGGSGLEMRIRITAGQANQLTRFNQISLPTNVDAAIWTVGDATITLQGPNPTDVTKIMRASDFTELYSFIGSGTFSFPVGENFRTEVFFRREEPSGIVLMRSLPFTIRINFGDNGTIPLFYGPEIQLAQTSDVTVIRQAVEAYLDAAISSRLPATAQTDINAIKTNTNLIPAAL